MTRSDEYRQLVHATYEQKRRVKSLPLELMEPTVLGLKTIALSAVEQRYHPKDDRLLTSFFGQHSGMTAYRKAIDDQDENVFRPLYNWLWGKTKKPQGRHIELLAWLIDFEGRPFDPTINYGAALSNISDDNIKLAEEAKDESELKVEEEDEKKIEEQELGETKAPIIHINSNNTSRLKRVFFGSVILILVAGFGIYLWYNRTKVIEPHCMYWNGEEYKSSSCSVKKDYPSQVIRLDTIKQMRLKRNMRPDTLTAYSIGKNWYIHIKGKYEYYTDSGYYPPDTNLRLLKVSAQILNTDYPREPVK